MTDEVLLAVDASTAELTADDRVLREALVSRGVECRPLVWDGDVPVGGRVVLRSTWDYVERAERFRGWLGDLDSNGVEVHNPTALVRWNLHKRYLVDLADADVPIVPTVLLEQGSGWRLDEVLGDNGWREAVVKPAIGATARLTVHTGRLGIAAASDHLAALLTEEDALVQPYLADVEHAGELSVVVVGGAITHAVVKRPADGEWRVQHEFGGRAELVEPTADQRAVVESALGGIDTVPTFARVDLLRDGHEWLLNELELIEPELFFRLAPEAADALAAALVGEAGRPTGV